MKLPALHWQILIGMILGAAIGLPLNIIDEQAAQTVAAYGKAVGDLFLRLLSMIVVPLIVSSLVTGVSGMGSLSGLASFGGRTFAYYIGTSMLAIVVGVAVVNIIQPGVGADLAVLTQSAEHIDSGVLASGPSLGETLWGQVLNMVPKNPVAAMADPANGAMLAVIFFSLLLGVFIVKVGGEHGKRLADIFASVFAVMMQLTMFVVALAPIGVLGFMLHVSAGSGFDVFAPLLKYMLTVSLGLAFHAMVTLPLLLLLLAKRSPTQYAQAMAPALLTAFSTASSNGTLPLTLTCVEKRAGIDNRVGSFVLPLGATINMDGTALYEAVAVLFIAQAYGIELSVAQQVTVAFTALLASVGAAGIPHAGLVMMIVVLNAVQLPLEGVGLILAVDRILDMCRTAVNVWSDSTATAVIARVTNNGASFAAAPAPAP